MVSREYELMDREEYLGYVADKASLATEDDRLIIMTMPLEVREPLVHKVVNELGSAAGRGADVLLVADANVFLAGNGLTPGPLWRPGRFEPSSLGSPFKERYEALESISARGGRYAVVNQPERWPTLPQAGRSHIKFAVINDAVSVGKHNLSYTSELDLMATTQDSSLADSLSSFASDVAAAGSVERALNGADRQEAIAPDIDLLVDAGVPKRSLILDEALEFIDSSEEWLFMCTQFFPGGAIGRRLDGASQRLGDNAQVVYNDPAAHGIERPLHAGYEMLHKAWLSDALFSQRLPKGYPILHFSCIANEHGVILGSHNLVRQGVQLGTAELVTRIRDVKLSRMVVSRVASLLPDNFVRELPV